MREAFVNCSSPANLLAGSSNTPLPLRLPFIWVSKGEELKKGNTLFNGSARNPVSIATEKGTVVRLPLALKIPPVSVFPETDKLFGAFRELSSSLALRETLFKVSFVPGFFAESKVTSPSKSTPCS